MNLRMIFAACAIAAFGSSMMTIDALAQKQSLKEQLVGTWTLLSWEQKKGDGTKLERYGATPKGIAFFDDGGRYIITVMRSDRAKYASNALWQGTPDESKETNRTNRIDLMMSVVRGSPLFGVDGKWLVECQIDSNDPRRTSKRPFRY